MATDTTTKRTYEIATISGKFRMDIPETWKVTFGPVSPGSKGGYASGGNCLRVYESDTKQRAIFLDVVSFRDLSIPVQRLVVREEGKEKWEVDNGNRKRSSSVKAERRWVPESEIEEPTSDEVPF